MIYKLGSLFDGSGGFPLAGALCGIEPTWAAEVEPYPIAVTRSRFDGDADTPLLKLARKHHPELKLISVHLGNVCEINGAEIEPVDIITFGSPCQDLSVAGKRAGLKHAANGDEETTRSGLFMEAVRIIKEMREATNGRYPTFALWENVPGAFSSNNGEDFRVVCEELIKIVEPTAVMPSVPKGGWAYADSYCGDGWSLAYRVFDAQYWGVPQRRRRIHLVVDFRGERAREILFEREGVRGYFAQGRTPWKGTAPDAQNGFGVDDCSGEIGGGRGIDAVAISSKQQSLVTNGNVANTLGANDYKEPQAVAYTLKIRSGVAIDSAGKAAGKGPLVQVDKAATLSTVQDQYLFAPSAVYDARGNGDGEISNTLTGDHNNRVTDYTSVVVESAVVAPIYCIDGDKVGKAERAGGSGLGIRPGDSMYTLTAKDVHGVCIPIHDQATRCTGKRGDKTDGKGNGLGVGEDGDPMNTLTAGDRHAVVYAVDQGGGKSSVNVSAGVSPTLCTTHYGEPAVAYGLDRASFNQGQNAKFDFSVTKEQQPTPVAKGPGAVAYWDGSQVCGTLTANNAGGNQRMPDKENFNCVIARNGNSRVRYIVRRLTPTECARLQGFDDRWGDINHKDSFTDEEYLFWLDVRNTHAAINGKAVKDYTKEQMLKWYNNLHTDSAEYKMWGNGIALPPALYCMQGIAEALKSENTNGIAPLPEPPKEVELMATCKDCLHVDVCGWSYLPPTAEQCVDFKDKAKYVVREKGEWIGEADGYADGELVCDVWYCPECNYCIDDGTDDPALLPNFCPNCGSDMRRGENG